MTQNSMGGECKEIWAENAKRYGQRMQRDMGGECKEIWVENAKRYGTLLVENADITLGG